VIIILKLVPDLRCEGCGALHRLVSKKSHLCLFCTGLKLDVSERKRNLDGTLRERFAVISK